MATIFGNRTVHGTIGTTADKVRLDTKVRQVSVWNTHATNSLSVTVANGNGSASSSAESAVVTAVTDAKETFHIGPGQRVVVYKNRTRPQWIALGVVGSGAGTTFSVHGTDWTD